MSMSGERYSKAPLQPEDSTNTRALGYLYSQVERNEIALDDAINQYMTASRIAESTAVTNSMRRVSAEEARYIADLQRHLLVYVIDKRRERHHIELSIRRFGVSIANGVRDEC